MEMKDKGKKTAWKWGVFALAATLAASVVGFALPQKSVQAATAERTFSMDEMLTPIWEGETAYNESVLVVEEEDGSIAPISLLYEIENIISVKSATLEKTYVQGQDYTFDEGKLIIKKNGNIPTVSYDVFHPEQGGNTWWSGVDINARDGGYLLFAENKVFHGYQIVVTYTHQDAYEGYIPEGKGALLERTLQNIEDGELNMLVYGDSISTGANSSGGPFTYPQLYVAPYMPIYPEMFAEGIKSQYGTQTVNVYNESEGGRDSAWGLSNLRSKVFDKYENLDLILLAFGMNDVSLTPEQHANNMRKMVRGLRSQYADADILLVAPMLPNYDAVDYYKEQPNFHTALLDLEEQGVAVVNVTSLHESILQGKRYADITGNNVNHANDYTARMYAQALLKTLEVSSYGTESETPETPETPEPTPDDTEKQEEGGCNGSVAACGALMTCLLAAAIEYFCNKK